MLHDPSSVLLAKAQDDQRLALLGARDTTISDEQLGFLAQQAIEKSLKSVLSFHRIAYRRTHDLSELLDLLKANQITFPSALDACITLTPFATEMRYDYLPIEPDESPFDRAGIMQLVRLGIEWAQRHIESPQ